MHIWLRFLMSACVGQMRRAFVSARTVAASSVVAGLARPSVVRSSASRAVARLAPAVTPARRFASAAKPAAGGRVAGRVAIITGGNGIGSLCVFLMLLLRMQALTASVWESRKSSPLRCDPLLGKWGAHSNYLAGRLSGAVRPRPEAWRRCCGQAEEGHRQAEHHGLSLAALSSGLRTVHGRAQFVQADVSKLADMQKVAAQAVAKYGKIDILLANAGVMPEKRIDDMTEADW